ncbi:MAG TPA: hypothetical protein VLB85_07160 [Acidimicrobiia bacterium]|nr:hypothetical protein [Acidimicrobiia bacterium]
MKRIAAAIVFASLLVMAGPGGRAEACSCAMVDPATMLEDSAGAFVGTLVERPTEPTSPDGFTGIWVFEVEEWVKGDLGPTVGVHSALDGAACGFEMAEGDRAGVFLYNDNGRPSSGLCSVTTPEALLTATNPVVFDGTGPPVFLIAADTGRTRLATLDANGRLLAAVGDDRFSWSVALCPGGDRLVEVVGGEVTLRDVDDLTAVEVIPPPPAGRAEQAWCLDEEGSHVLAQVWAEDGSASRFELLGNGRVVYDGEPAMFDAAGGRLAVSTGTGGIEVIDILTGASVGLVPGTEPGRLDLSDDGTRLLVSRAEFPPQGSYVTVARVHDARTGEVEFDTGPLADIEVYGWLDQHRLIAAHYPAEADFPTTLVIDTTSGEITETVAPDWPTTVIGDAIVSVGEGHLYLTEPGADPVELAILPTPGHRLVAVIDDQAQIEAPTTTESPDATQAPAPEAASAREPALPLAVAMAALAGVAAIVAAGWSAIRRRRRA